MKTRHEGKKRDRRRRSLKEYEEMIQEMPWMRWTQEKERDDI